jgi:hypothetical protein
VPNTAVTGKSEDPLCFHASVATVHSAEGEIPVQILERGTATLIECRQAAAFLRHIGALRPGTELPRDAFVRAVVTRGEGAWVELLDSLGVLCAAPWRLGAADAARLFGDAC